MNKKLIPVFLIVLVDVFGLMLILPMLPLYAERMGASAFVASLLFTAYAACQLIASPFLGQLSDRIGRKPVLLLSQVGTLSGFILLAFANTLPLVFLSRIIDGFTAGNISVAHAYIADVSEPQERARSFGFIGVAFALGFVLGPALAGLLASYGPHIPVYAAIFASAASIVTTATLLPGRDPKQQQPDAGAQASLLNPNAFMLAVRNKSLALLLLQFALFSLAFSGFFSGFSLYGERRYLYNGQPFTVREIGLALTMLGLSAIPVQIFVLPRVLKKFGERALISFSYIGLAVGFMLLSIPSPLIFMIVAVGSLGVMSSLLRPSLISLITQHASREQQGMIMGLVQSTISICQIISPLYGGALIGAGFLRTWAFVPAGLALTAWTVSRSSSTHLNR